MPIFSKSPLFPKVVYGIPETGTSLTFIHSQTQDRVPVFRIVEGDALHSTGEAVHGLPLVSLITKLFGLIAAKIQTSSLCGTL